MTNASTYATMKDLFEERGGEFSGECDFGVWWYHDPARVGRGPYYRVSVIHDTGDVYAFNQWTHQIELLCTLLNDCDEPEGKLRHGPGCAYSRAEQMFAGWSEGGSKPLAWIRERIG